CTSGLARTASFTSATSVLSPSPIQKAVSGGSPLTEPRTAIVARALSALAGAGAIALAMTGTLAPDDPPASGIAGVAESPASTSAPDSESLRAWKAGATTTVGG